MDLQNSTKKEFLPEDKLTIQNYKAQEEIIHLQRENRHKSK